MLTKEGRYFTGEKTYWYACPEKSGRVDQIEAAVKAYDNEGRVFKSPVIKLTLEQVHKAMENTRAHQEVIAELVRETYEKGCAAEELLARKVNDGIRNGPQTESKAGQDSGHAEDAAVQGPGDLLANG